MDDRSLSFFEGSEEITGYRVKIMPKPAYQVIGYTLIVEPHQESKMVAQFMAEMAADGRLEALKKSLVRPGVGFGPRIVGGSLPTRRVALYRVPRRKRADRPQPTFRTIPASHASIRGL